MGLLNIIRRMHLRQKLSIREIARLTGVSRNTVTKYLATNIVEPKFATPEWQSKLDPFAEICRRAGISQATYFNWKKKYAGLLPTEMKRLQQLEDENSRLKKIVADLTLDREMLQDVIRRKI